MSTLVHETKVTYFTFPLLAVQLKEYKKQLSDAVWEENQDKIAKLKDKIRSTEIQIALGETYDVPF